MKRVERRGPGSTLLLALSAAALVLGACAGKETSSGPSGAELSITSPSDGGSVTGPVHLTLSVQGTEIGPPDTGNMHFHVYIDGSDDYQVITDVEAELSVPDGEHTIRAVLAEPNHTETDLSASVTVSVTGGAGASPSPGGYGGGGYGDGRYGDDG